MNYKIILEDEAKLDIRLILKYYEYDLELPHVGLKIVRKIHEVLSKLRTSPDRFYVYEQAKADKEIHLVHSGKYNIYYTIVEGDKTVHILRIFHARQNQAL